MCIWDRVKEVKPKNVGLELIGWAFGISEEKEKRGPCYVQDLYYSKATDDVVILERIFLNGGVRMYF